MPALSRARKQALQASCGSNARQQVYACVAYGNDWEEELPTKNGNGEGDWREPFYMTRLPMVGFDTVTVVPQDSYNCMMSCASGEGIGGWAYMLRDYLKNDFDVVVCPDGWWNKKFLLRKNSSTTPAGIRIPLGMADSSVAVAPSGIWGVSGYLWLPHRVWRPGITDVCYAASGSTYPGPGCVTDRPKMISKTASDRPELMIVVDWNVWATGAGRPERLAANHQTSGVKNSNPWDPDSIAPIFDPLKWQQTNYLDVMLGTNEARIDARVTWVPWQDLVPFRYNANGGVSHWCIW